MMERAARAGELAASVEQTLLQEASRNGLRLAYVRVLVLATFVVIDAAFYFFPQQTLGVARPASPANALLALLWCGVSVAVVIALRAGWNSAAFRAALVALDPLIVFTLFWLIFTSLRGTQNMMYPAVTASAFTLVAVTGALQLSRYAAAWSAALSVAGFAGVAVVLEVRPAAALLICTLVAGAGLLGMRLAENTRRAAAAEGSRVILRRFLPAQLAESDPQTAIGLVSRPRNVEATILVSDLRGFTALAELLAPAAVLAALNAIQGSLAACVRKHGGTVDKFMGDGMLAVFGVPEVLPNHAAAAIASALDMRDVVASGSLKLGIGIHSGPVVAGCVGSGERLEFTVIGDTVNTASRLEGVTKELGVEIVLSERAKTIASNWVAKEARFSDLGEIALRGRTARIRVFTVSAR